jgi:4-methylaminobutanoate oxidase (formaldehyde-forming)
MEKAYRSWGHDISAGDNPLQAGLGFTIKWDKPGGFIGREALLAAKEAGISRRLVQFKLDDPQHMLFHDEPIYRDGQLVGRVASAMYGHTLGGATALGWVVAPEVVERGWFENGAYEIETGDERVPATASLRPMYDPKSERPKS